MRTWDLSRILIKPNQHIAASCDTCYFYLPLYADLARLQTSGENQKRRKKMSTNHTHKSRSPQNKNWKNRTNTSKLVLQQFFLHFQHFPQHHERPTRKEKAKVEKHVRERFILEFTCAPLSCAAFFSSSPHGLKLEHSNVAWIWVSTKCMTNFCVREREKPTRVPVFSRGKKIFVPLTKNREMSTCSVQGETYFRIS